MKIDERHDGWVSADDSEIKAVERAALEAAYEALGDLEIDAISGDDESFKPRDIRKRILNALGASLAVEKDAEDVLEAAAKEIGRKSFGYCVDHLRIVASALFALTSDYELDISEVHPYAKGGTVLMEFAQVAINAARAYDLLGWDQCEPTVTGRAISVLRLAANDDD